MQKAISYKEIILWLFAIIFITIFPHTGLAPNFSYAIPVLLLIYFVLKQSAETFNDIGFSFNRFNTKAVIYGSIAGIAIFCFTNYIFFPLLEKVMTLEAANLDSFKFIKGNTGAYIFILMMGWAVGGCYEEIVFHGFIFTQLEKILDNKYAIISSFLISNIIFSVYHVQLGTAGMINAFVAGCGYHAIMLYFKRNLWYAFFAHGIFDTIGLTLIYKGYW